MTQHENEAPEPSKEELLVQVPAGFDTDRLQFEGLRGDVRFHLTPAQLIEKLKALPPPPRDHGRVDFLVARGADFSRSEPQEVTLARDSGMPGDRFGNQDKYGADYQLATTRTDFATVVANGQPLSLHGDNLFITLDLSDNNLPPKARLRMGEALVEVTPQEHNGCKKWVQRFGLAPMRLNMAPHFKSQHLRGIYLKVIEEGRVRVGDPIEVISRP